MKLVFDRLLLFPFLSFILIDSLSAQSAQELIYLQQMNDQRSKTQQQLPAPGLGGEAQAPGLPGRAAISPYVPFLLEETEAPEINHFGYDFFTLRNEVAFWENLPTPVSYLLGPGDELIIALWGETQLRSSLIISRDGKIYDEKVGLLNISGKTMEEAKIYLKNQFGRIYATLKGRNPSTYMDVSLGALRSINVNFVGQVKYPGVYPVHPFSTVITGLIQAGGVDTLGSLRNVQIKRDGKLYSTVDLYAYFLQGELPDKIQLRDQDIIVIPMKNLEVTIDSAVVRPGIYEGVTGETIYDLIHYAGGLKPSSSAEVGLKRIVPLEKRRGKFNHENFYLELENTKLIEIQAGDHISVRHIFHEQQIIQLIGQVKVPGIYNFFEGMMLTDLLELGGGLRDSSFLKSMYLDKAEIIRRQPESRYADNINVNLSELIKHNENSDIALQNLDRVVIHANPNYFERENIWILGEVNIPGSYPLLSDAESLMSMIIRAGGLTSKALDGGIAIYRDKIYFEKPPRDKTDVQEEKKTDLFQTTEKNKEEDNNKIRLAWKDNAVVLMPGDSIVVKERTGTVYVTGEVYNPGLVEFQKGKSIRYYLDSAGSINNYGDRNNVIVILPNGITIPWHTFSSPKIIDGSTIVVYKKADMTPFDLNQFAASTVSLLTSLITIIVLSQQLGG